MPYNKSIIAASLMSIISSPVFAGDLSEGARLHQEGNCLSCHQTRPYSKIKTPNFAKLEARVNGCSNQLNLGWFEDEVSAVSHYLDATYYHFSK
ncbi:MULTISPECIES: hypothetical protein [Thiomicrorhabdus]|uniref:Cytochrome c n=1 Tax=Thiomicrorhabdus heinhorstiae TaxID=2748010 RepID=A0ABS0BYR1_9GAMM|nr:MULTISPECIES: hypothetical protein [Thiomicrorhabdus]MBF6058223.1 hypothetical protein [Thiomicrorhabdus heinhorstiae]